VTCLPLVTSFKYCWNLLRTSTLWKSCQSACSAKSCFVWRTPSPQRELQQRTADLELFKASLPRSLPCGASMRYAALQLPLSCALRLLFNLLAGVKGELWRACLTASLPPALIISQAYSGPLLCNLLAGVKGELSRALSVQSRCHLHICGLTHALCHTPALWLCISAIPRCEGRAVACAEGH
jgi:hypothetical protein